MKKLKQLLSENDINEALPGDDVYYKAIQALPASLRLKAKKSDLALHKLMKAVIEYSQAKIDEAENDIKI